VTAAAAVAALFGPTMGLDIGQKFEAKLAARAKKLFGVEGPLERPANEGDVVPRAQATADQRQLLAESLSAEFVARNVSYLGDMISFWPTDVDYTHLMVCSRECGAGL